VEPALSDDWTYTPPPGALAVLHHDRDLFVVDKPSGLLSVPGRDPAHRDSATVRATEQSEGRVFAVHRLDMDTSGVLVFATRRKSERELFRQFRERLVTKRYVAWVAGQVPQDRGLIELPLRREQGRPRSMVHPDGRPARTRYEVLARRPAATCLALHPETGRSHQLRVHCLALGHPILGDRFYAPPSTIGMAPRLMLHAERLNILHPWSGQPLEVHAPSPFSLSEAP